MAEINLLKNQNPTTNTWQTVSSLLVKVLVLLVLLVIGYYVFLFFKVKSTTQEIANLQTSIEQSKSSALTMAGREEFLVRQAQLKEFVALSNAHVYYSKLVPALAKVTLKTAFYTSLSLGQQGKLNLQVTVPTLEDLDKYLQVFDQPEIAKDFYNVRLGGFSKSADLTSSVYIFSATMDYNPQILSGKAFSE